MYGIFMYICHQIQPNVGEYTIHGYMDPMGMILPILLSSWWFQWSRIVLTPLYTWSKMIFFNWVESTHCFGWVCFSIGGVLNLYGIKIATFEGIRTLLGGPNKISCCFYFAWGRNSCSIDVLNEPTTPPTGRTFCWLTFLTSGLWILPEMDFPPFVLSTRISWDLSLRSPRVCCF